MLIRARHGLAFDGIGNGGIGLSSVVVSDDGAIYACNIAPASGGYINGVYDATRIFRLYRWADGNSLKAYHAACLDAIARGEPPATWAPYMHTGVPITLAPRTPAMPDARAAHTGHARRARRRRPGAEPRPTSSGAEITLRKL